MKMRRMRAPVSLWYYKQEGPQAASRIADIRNDLNAEERHRYDEILARQHERLVEIGE